MWASPSVAAKAVAHTVHEDCRSWLKPSDHVPLVTEFAF
jgi:exodeoxyribonuclease-3